MPGKRENRTPAENAALERIFHSEHPSGAHTAAEAEFNRERERRLRAEGFTGEYKPQRDVRHEFEFSQKREERTGVTETMARSKGPLRNPDEVINWRDTEVGLKADEKARRAYHGSGDDGGHLISPEFGANPGDPRNLSKQNFVANETGTFKRFENDCKATVAGQSHPHEIEVRVRSKGEGEQEREFTRSMKLYQHGENGERRVAKELDFANTKTQAGRAAEAGGSADRAGDWEHNREVKSALADPGLEAKKAEWARLKRNKSADLTPEEKLQLREEMRERAIEGGLHKKKHQ